MYSVATVATVASVGVASVVVVVVSTVKLSPEAGPAVFPLGSVFKELIERLKQLQMRSIMMLSMSLVPEFLLP